MLLSSLAWLTLVATAQFYPGGGNGPGGGFGRGGRGRGGMGGGFGGNRSYIISDPAEQAMVDKMQKALKPGFEDDVFTFARLIYTPDGGGGGFGRGRSWDDDTPDADLNLGFRLFQVTSLKVHPAFKYIHITPQEMADYPFVYMVANSRLALSEDEVKIVRHYLLSGGFLMAEDFWGDSTWEYVYGQFKRIFPDREIVELPLTHPIFHSVFDFKDFPQMPSAGGRYYPNAPSWDNADYPTGDHFPHYYAIFDDHDHMMALICRNNHYGDGWEHEGENEDYFKRFSMAQAYPMFINILFYASTH